MKNIPSVPTASLWSGFWFVFNYEQVQFAFWVSPSGKEELYVNSRLVSECRRIALSGSHLHTEGDVSYEILVKVTSAARAEIDCSFLRNGVLQGFLRTKLVRLSLWLRIALVVGMGVPTFLVVQRGAPIWLAIPMVLATFLVYRFAGVGHRFLPSAELPRLGKGA